MIFLKMIFLKMIFLKMIFHSIPSCGPAVNRKSTDFLWIFAELERRRALLPVEKPDKMVHIPVSHAKTNVVYRKICGLQQAFGLVDPAQLEVGLDPVAGDGFEKPGEVIAADEEFPGQILQGQGLPEMLADVALHLKNRGDAVALLPVEGLGIGAIKLQQQRLQQLLAAQLPEGRPQPAFFNEGEEILCGGGIGRRRQRQHVGKGFGPVKENGS